MLVMPRSRQYLNPFGYNRSRDLHVYSNVPFHALQSPSQQLPRKKKKWVILD